ncbi:MAG: hypothetical protein ACI4RA_03720 [Kiritimatiellia bacterium]
MRSCLAAYLITWCGLSACALESPAVSLADVRWKNFQPASEVYIDTTLQFMPAMDAMPGVDVTKDKLAIWLNVSASGTATNLCVYSSMADLAPVKGPSRGGLRLGARGAETVMRPHVFKLQGTETIQPGRWYRLTVRTIKDVTRRAEKTGDAARGLLGFQIYLDGALLASSEASFPNVYTSFASGSEGWLDPVRDASLLAFLRSGTVFVSLCGESADDAVGSVGFRGEGEFDDIDVSADAPDFVGISSLDFTLAFTPGESVVAEMVGGATQR